MATTIRAPRGAPAGRRWDEPISAPLVLVRGQEEYLRELAVKGVRASASAKLGPLEVVDLNTATYERGDLAVATSPSLFAEPKLVVLSGLEANANADDDLLEYVSAPNPDACVVVVHSGGVRGKKVLDTFKAANVPVLECAELKRDADKASFVVARLKALGRKAEPEAISALLDALGSDLRSLAAAVEQLAADVPGAITPAAVYEYHGGKVEATSFSIADAAIAGDAVEALKLFRHALAIGLKGPELTGALAAKLRLLAKVGAIRAGEATARELGMTDWQVRNGGAHLIKWSANQVAEAIEAVASADFAVKGGATLHGPTWVAEASPEHVLERLVIAVALRR